MKIYNGFTLVELMVIIAITIILLGIAIPSLSSLYNAQRANMNIRKIQQSLQFARSAAINYGITVSVCPIENEQCSDNWRSGLMVFTDSGIKRVIDGSDKLLYQTGAFNQQDIVTYNRPAVRFYPDGLASGSNGTLKYCPSSAANPNSKAVVINLAGRIRFSTEKNINCMP